MHIKVLGSAAGGGFPQWNCACRNCLGIRSSQSRWTARTQAQVAVSNSESGWLLLNASPDLRAQILATKELAPTNPPRDTPISAIILTSAEVDSVAGLLHLREFQPFRIFATPSVKRILLEENRIFRVLERANPPIVWYDIPVNAWFSVDSANSQSGLQCLAVNAGGAYPDYVSPQLRNALPPEGAAVALVFSDGKKQMLYAPSVSGTSVEWKTWAQSSDLSLLDGTFWDDRELINAGISKKTAREIGHVPLSGPGGMLENLDVGTAGRRVLIHVNNTNPILDELSSERAAVKQAGWEIAYDGMDIAL